MNLKQQDKKILSPLAIFANSSYTTQDRQDDAISQIGKLTSIISKFSDMMDKKISSLSQMIQRNNGITNDRMILDESEHRFKELRFPIQNIKNLDKNERQKKIKIFCSDLARKLLAIIFKSFQQGQINQHKLRQFFCNNFLFNIIEFCTQNQLEKNQIQIMDRHLKEKVFTFLQQRYPQNQSSYASGKFDKLVNLVDNIQSNSNDLIFLSGIKFFYKQNEDYSKQIMQLVNYLIKLSSPQQKLYEQFKQQMEQIFKNVYDMEWMAKARKNIFDFPQQKGQITSLGQLNQKKQNNIIMQQAFKMAQQKIITQQEIKQHGEKQKYKKSVKQYTKYLIGKKISDNAVPFQKKAIDEQNLIVNNPTIMRILTKWCEQLQKNFDQININSRSQRFRMQDGTQRNIKKQNRQKFYVHLNKKHENIKKFIDKSMDNIYQNQLYMIKNPDILNSFREFSSQQQGKVGYFASALKKSHENYLISYLNKLIHNILSAQKDLKSQVPRKQQYKVAINQISFKLGDLFRCKISSKQPQIIALYYYLQVYCERFKNKLQIIRVKNRLSESTKDILINLKFRKKIVVQMQLSVNEDISNFMKCSSIVKHFLYEIQRATFGPISQICNVYSSVDSRAEFFRKNFEKIQNQTKKPKKTDAITQKQNFCEHETYEQSTFPCWCTMCNCFSYSLNIQQKHRICKCKTIICSKCTTRKSHYQIQQNLDFKQISKELWGRKQNQRMKRIKVLDLQTKRKYIKDIYLFYFNFKILFLQEESLNKLTILGEAKTKQQFSNFFTKKQINTFQNISKFQMERLFPLINGQILSKYMETIQKRKKKHFIIQEIKVSSDVFKKRSLNDVETVIIRGLPSLESTKNLTIAFPDAKVILINKNAIKSLQNIQAWKKAEELNLQGNKLQNICPQICQLQQLNFLVLSRNKFKQFPFQICRIPKLKKLQIKNNQIRTICPKIVPQNGPEVSPKIGQLKFLQVLKLSNNLISQIQKSISTLQNLKQLDLSYNLLGGASQNEQVTNDFFQGMVNLTQIDFTSNRYQYIPSTLKGKDKLKIIDFTKNKIKKVSSFVFQLKSLQQLILTLNQISEIQIDQKNQKISPLKKLYLDNNQLTQIHQRIYTIKTIQKFKIGNQNLAYDPIKLRNLPDIIQIGLHNMKLQQFPQAILSLKRLQKVSFYSNHLNSLPKNIGILNQTLRQINISNNKFTEFPKQILDLTNLEILRIQNNYFTQIPQKILDLKRLQKVYLCYDSDVIEIQEIEDQKLQLTLKQDSPKEKKIKSPLALKQKLYISNNQVGVSYLQNKSRSLNESISLQKSLGKSSLNRD